MVLVIVIVIEMVEMRVGKVERNENHPKVLMKTLLWP